MGVHCNVEFETMQDFLSLGGRRKLQAALQQAGTHSKMMGCQKHWLCYGLGMATCTHGLESWGSMGDLALRRGEDCITQQWLRH